MLKFVVAVCFVLFMGMVNVGFGQNTEDSVLVELIRDPRLDELAKKQSAINKVTSNLMATSQYRTSSGKYKGFRIMVLNTNDRNLAYQTRGKLSSLFPGNNIYLAYQAPFFKLKMGDFIDKADAELLKKQLAGVVKSGVYVIPDVINIRPEDEEKILEKALKKAN